VTFCTLFTAFYYCIFKAAHHLNSIGLQILLDLKIFLFIPSIMLDRLYGPRWQDIRRTYCLRCVYELSYLCNVISNDFIFFTSGNGAISPWLVVARELKKFTTLAHAVF